MISMPEYSFKLAGGDAVKIVGDFIKGAIETSDFLSEYGPKTAIKIYKTRNRGFLATVEFDPGVGNQKKGDAWTGFVPDFQRPNNASMDELKSEFESDLTIGKFPNVIIENQVKQAIGKLFPTSGPTVID